MSKQNTTTAQANSVQAEKWQYVGDVNIEYGGMFIDTSTLDEGYADVLRVTDLDSACGFDGAVLIEKIVVYINDDGDRLQNALDCYGWFKSDIDQDSLDGQIQLVEACEAYGYYDKGWDCYSPTGEVVQTDFDAPMTFDGWTATKRISTDDLKGYCESQLH